MFRIIVFLQRIVSMNEKDNNNLNVNKNNRLLSLLLILFGIALNFLFAKIAAQSGMPVYIDNIGTIVAGVLGGYLPGIFVAVANNLINYTLDAISIYYAGVSALIAIAAVNCYRKGWFTKVTGVIKFILLLAVIGGVIGGTITWFLSGATEEGIAGEWYLWCRDTLDLNNYLSHILSTFALELIDKTITAMVALIIIKLIPLRIRPMLWFSGWKQTPVTEEEKKLEKSLIGGDRHSLNAKIALMLVFATLAMALVVTGVSSSLFNEYSKNQHKEIVDGAAKVAAHAIDPEKVDEYLEKGEAAKGYTETEKRLYAIRDYMPDIEYIYVYVIESDGCHVVFDLDTAEVKGNNPGDLVEFDPSFKEYIPTLLRGGRIDPIESDDKYGWLLTAYEPVYNSKGECVCYAAADEMVSGINEYERDFAIKVVLLFFGFFILILVIGLWMAKYHVILPINSMASLANKFAYSEEENNDDMMESSLNQILDLKIRTGDEVQKLYESFCKMTIDTVDHVNDIRHQSEAIEQLQDGLIVTMADMVEGRDSDTGNHVRKTAAYARIIMESLRSMGCYTDQLTDKYISDVEKSAPLHDVGKISVSDVILNKPGKLTDEEFCIMQTHTTAGKEMIDQVIQTVHGESYLMEGRNLAGYHHEKWNGKGYPEGLAGEEIPLSARVMAIADVFDALSSKRIYKDAMPFEKAVSIIKEDSGSHFDPKCVEAFLNSLDEIRAVLDQYNELEAKGERVKGNEVSTETEKDNSSNS